MALKLYVLLCSFQITLTILAKPVASLVELSDLFPYSESDGNTRFQYSDDTAREVRFTSPFKYLNTTYWTTYIISNGIISFGAAVTTGWNECRPGNTRKIMPFWGDANYVNSGDKILYMENSDSTSRRKAATDIVKAFPQFRRKITISWMLVVTWLDLVQLNQSPSRRNTFQMVLATYDTHSFVIFYYNKLTWPTTSSPIAVAGFGYGNDRNVYRLPGSCSPSILNLIHQSNINEPGKFVFQVDSDIIHPSLLSHPTCGSSNKGFLDDDSIRFEPAVVSVMGNIPVIAHGPCLGETDNVTCSFQDASRTQPITTKGIVLPGKVTICPLPFLYSLGQLRVTLVVKEDDKATIYQGNIYVVREEVFSKPPNIYLNRTMDESILLSATWRQSDFQLKYIQKIDDESKENENENKTCHVHYDVVQIVLLEYDGMKWKELGALSPIIMNNGVHMSPLNTSLLKQLVKHTEKILPRSLALKKVYNLSSVQGELIKIIPSSITISTDLLSIAFQKQLQLQTENGKTVNAFDTMCDKWFQKQLIPVLDAFPCPVTSDLARLDWRFSIDKASHFEWFNRNVTVTYAQKLASPSGEASQCAYDTEGNLMDHSSLQKQSLTSIRNHWNHYWNDVLPFLFCCQWSNQKEENCEKYYLRRSVNVLPKYVPPTPARISGCGHITTFDGYSYTFNGRGEFWLMKYDDDGSDSHSLPSHFFIQVRMEPYKSWGTYKNVSVITAIVMEQIRNGDHLKIQVSTLESRFSHKLMITVDDGKGLRVDSLTDEFTLHYKGAAISIVSLEELAVTFSAGLSFKIFVEFSLGSKSLSIVCEADKNLLKGTEGLWGTFDGNPVNDLQLPNGNFLDVSSTMNEVHSDFGVHWVTAKEETLFKYQSEESHESYNLPGFEPTFFSLDANYSESGDEFCDGFRECLFDYTETDENFLIATETKRAYTLYQEIFNMSQSSALTGKCNKFVSLMNGNIVTSGRTVGTTLEVKCHTGFTLTDDNKTELGQSINLICLTPNETNSKSKPQWKTISEKAVTNLSCIALAGSGHDLQNSTKAERPILPTPTFIPKTVATTTTATTPRTKPKFLAFSTDNPSTKPALLSAITENLILSSTVNENKNKILFTAATTETPFHAQEAKSSAVSTPDLRDNSKGEIITFTISFLIFIVVIVVIIAECPICKPARRYFANRYCPTRQMYSVSMSEGINLNH